MRRTSAPVWGAPIRLLHANDLGGWHATAQQNQWEVKDGVLLLRDVLASFPVALLTTDVGQNDG